MTEWCKVHQLCCAPQGLGKPDHKSDKKLLDRTSMNAETVTVSTMLHAKSCLPTTKWPWATHQLLAGRRTAGNQAPASPKAYKMSTSNVFPSTLGLTVLLSVTQPLALWSVSAQRLLLRCRSFCHAARNLAAVDLNRCCCLSSDYWCHWCCCTCMVLKSLLAAASLNPASEALAELC